MYTMVIQDIFTIKTAGCVVVGMVDGDTIHVGDSVYIISRGAKMTATRIEGMENPSQGKMQTATPVSNAIVFSFENYAEIIQKDPNISGIVINPFGANFIVDRKLSEHLRTTKDIVTKGVSEQKVAKDTNVWLGEPKVYPTEMIEAVKDHLQKEPAVKKASSC